MLLRASRNRTARRKGIRTNGETQLLEIQEVWQATRWIEGRRVRCVSRGKRNQTNGVNDGKNGGRACWAIAGTLCGGQVQGSFASKLSNCMQCEFYQLVGQEQGAEHESSKMILRLLK